MVFFTVSNSDLFFAGFFAFIFKFFLLLKPIPINSSLKQLPFPSNPASCLYFFFNFLKNGALNTGEGTVFIIK